MLKFKPVPPKLSQLDLFPALFDHFVTHCWFNFSPKGTSTAFSATLARSGRATQLSHNSSQPTPNLLRTNLSIPTLPRAQHCQTQFLRYYQLVVNHTDQG